MKLSEWYVGVLGGFAHLLAWLAMRHLVLLVAEFSPNAAVYAAVCSWWFALYVGIVFAIALRSIPVIAFGYWMFADALLPLHDDVGPNWISGLVLVAPVLVNGFVMLIVTRVRKACSLSIRPVVPK